MKTKLKKFTCCIETKGFGYIEVFAKDEKTAKNMIAKGKGRSIQDYWDVVEISNDIQNEDFLDSEYQDYMKECGND